MYIAARERLLAREGGVQVLGRAIAGTWIAEQSMDIGGFWMAMGLVAWEWGGRGVWGSGNLGSWEP